MGEANAQVWLGSVRQSTGDLAGAARLLEAAMDTFRRIGSRGSEAFALEGTAECQLRCGETESAVAHLGQALEIFQRMAMRPDADRVQARFAGLTSWSA